MPKPKDIVQNEIQPETFQVIHEITNNSQNNENPAPQEVLNYKVQQDENGQIILKLDNASNQNETNPTAKSQNVSKKPEITTLVDLTEKVPTEKEVITFDPNLTIEDVTQEKPGLSECSKKVPKVKYVVSELFWEMILILLTLLILLIT